MNEFLILISLAIPGILGMVVGWLISLDNSSRQRYTKYKIVRIRGFNILGMEISTEYAVKGKKKYLPIWETVYKSPKLIDCIERITELEKLHHNSVIKTSEEDVETEEIVSKLV